MRALISPAMAILKWQNFLVIVWSFTAPPACVQRNILDAAGRLVQLWLMSNMAFGVKYLSGKALAPLVGRLLLVYILSGWKLGCVAGQADDVGEGGFPGAGWNRYPASPFTQKYF
ncbi:MAG: hypothetical protein GY780_01690 [bacterium]|nr:hypothetical protein [bacterium]